MKRLFGNPFQGSLRRSLEKQPLSLQVLRATTLRRTKEAQLTSLGVKDVIVDRLAMSASERAFYDSIKERGLAGDCGNHLVTMLRLRQAAN